MMLCVYRARRLQRNGDACNWCRANLSTRYEGSAAALMRTHANRGRESARAVLSCFIKRRLEAGEALGRMGVFSRKGSAPSDHNQCN